MFLLLVPLAFAMQRRSGDSVVIASDEVVDDDLYVVARSVSIEGVVRGDVVTAAREVELLGVVEGDLVAVGEKVVVEGRVGDDLRAAGAVVELAPSGSVAGDVVAAAGAFQTKASIGGDSAIGAAQAHLGGRVGGAVRAAAGAIRIDGEIVGDVDADVGGEPATWSWPGTPALDPVPAGLTLGPSAHVGGDLRYRAPREAALDPLARAGRTVAHTPVEVRAGPRPWTRAVARALSLLVVGGAFSLLAPGLRARAVESLAHRPIRSLLMGVAASTLGVLGLGSLAATILGGALAVGIVTLGTLVPFVLLAGLAAMLAWFGLVAVATVWVGPALVALAAGEQLVGRRGFGALLLGVTLLVLATSIPVVGVVAGAFAMLLGIGALADTCLGKESPLPGAAEPDLSRPLSAT
jgi:cytoskeletal protein CcmA (bactofilin family)